MSSKLIQALQDGLNIIDEINNKQTIKEYINQLQNLYPKCQFDKYTNKNYKYNITYGEMDYEGIEILYNIVKKLINTNTFIDIGCGRGKLCCYMASKPIIKNIVGIELVKQRYDDCIELYNKLDKYYTQKIQFKCRDVLKINFTKFKSPVFIWLSNLCFDETNNNNIFNKLLKELSSNSIICCSKRPTDCLNIKLINNYTIPMSWSKESTVYLYQT